MGLSAGFTTLLGVVWRRQSKDIEGKCERSEIVTLLEKLGQHIADDRALIAEIREDRRASEKSRDQLHRKFNKIALAFVRLDERLANIGSRPGEPLGRTLLEDEDPEG